MADINHKKELFIKYNYFIHSFEKFITEIYQSKQVDSSKNKYKGYIIYLKEYEEFKENINYNKVKSFYSSQTIEQQKILEQFDIIKFNKIKNFKPIEFNTPRYLFYKISNKQNFIIINEELCKIIENIDNEKPSFIEYIIENNNYLSIKFENGENIKIYCDNNIINEYSLNFSSKSGEYKLYIDEYKNILKDTNSFYEIEKQFIDNSNQKENESFPKSGYFIKNSWINNWKKITNYEKIKTLIKLNNRNDIISDEIINHLEKNKLNYKDLPPLEIFNFQTKNELDDYLLNNCLVIINTNLMQSFGNNS